MNIIFSGVFASVALSVCVKLTLQRIRLFCTKTSIANHRSHLYELAHELLTNELVSAAAIFAAFMVNRKLKLHSYVFQSFCKKKYYTLY